MTVDVKLSAEFICQFKRLNKKYKSLTNDCASFLASIKVNPLQGSCLGGGVYKVRMPISSKGTYTINIASIKRRQHMFYK